MPTGELTGLRVQSDYDCNGGVVRGTLATFARESAVTARYTVAEGDRFEYAVPLDDPSASVLVPRAVVRRTYADGRVLEGRVRGERRSDATGAGTVLQVTVGCPLDDLTDAGPVSDGAGAVPTFTGSLVQATVAEWWAAVAAPTLAAGGVTGFALGTVANAATRYDWTWNNQPIPDVVRRVTGLEIWTTRNGTTNHLVQIGTRGAGTPTVTIAPDGAGLRRVDRGWSVDQQATAIIPQTGAGRGLADAEYRVTAAVSGTRTLTLADPEGVTTATGTTNDLAGLYLRRLATGRHYLIQSSDPATQTVVLSASTGWPADGWTAGATTGELVDVRATAPSLTAPHERLVRPWALGTGGSGLDWAVGTVNSGAGTVTVTARPTAPGTFRASVGDLTVLRNVQLRTATNLGAVSRTATVYPSTGAIVASTTWPAGMQVGDLLQPDAGSVLPKTALVIAEISSDRLTLWVQALYTGDVLGSALWAGSGLSDGDPLTPFSATYARLTSVAAPIVSCAAGSDTLTVENTTGVVAGDWLLLAAPAAASALAALIDADAVADYGRKTAVLPVSDAIARTAQRNLHPDGWLTQYSGGGAADGWTVLSGGVAKSTAAGTYRYGTASMALTSGGATLRSQRFRPWLGDDVTQVAVRMPVKYAATRPNTYARLGTVAFAPNGTLKLLDMSGGAVTTLATLTLAAGAIPDDGEWVDLVLRNAPVPPHVTDLAVELSLTGILGTLYVDGIQVTAGGESPEGLIAWSDGNRLVAETRRALAQYADPTTAAATYEVTVRDRYHEDETAYAGTELVPGGAVIVAHPASGINTPALRILELRADERALTTGTPVRLPSVTLTLARVPLTLTRLTT